MATMNNMMAVMRMSPFIRISSISISDFSDSSHDLWEGGNSVNFLTGISSVASSIPSSSVSSSSTASSSVVSSSMVSSPVMSASTMSSSMMPTPVVS